VLIGTTTDSGRLTVRGSGTTSATTALHVENTNASASLTITDDGASTFTAQSNATPITITGYVATGSAAQPSLDITGSWNTSGAPTLVKVNVTDSASNAQSNLLTLQVNGSNIFRFRKDGLFSGQGGFQVSPSGVVTALGFTTSSASTGTAFNAFNAQLGFTHTVSMANHFLSSATFNPTSGNGTFTSYNSNPTINQTGGSIGTTRGLYVNPTLTSAFDFRAIETTLGNVMLNTVGGNTLIGTSTNSIYKLDVNGTTRLRGNTIISATTSTALGSTLTVVGSGSTQPIFTVQGSSGELFSVTDSLIGSLFSVNDISGLPILEVFSNNTVLMGTYLAPSLNTTSMVTANSGTTTVYTIPQSAYTGAFFEYTVSDGTNLRAGNIMSIWSGVTVNFTETQTTDIGSTSAIAFTMSANTTNFVLQTSATTTNWIVKTIIRSI
jgi:hypothetical protein